MNISTKLCTLIRFMAGLDRAFTAVSSLTAMHSQDCSGCLTKYESPNSRDRGEQLALIMLFQITFGFEQKHLLYFFFVCVSKSHPFQWLWIIVEIMLFQHEMVPATERSDFMNFALSSLWNKYVRPLPKLWTGAHSSHFKFTEEILFFIRIFSKNK